MATYNSKIVDDTLSAIIRSPFRTALLSGAAALVPAFIFAYLDYRQYVSFGPHGLPDTFWGWRKQLSMSKFARPKNEVIEPAPYPDKESVSKALGPYATQSFFDTTLPERSGTRPQIPGYVAPQRQTTQLASERQKDMMSSFLDTIASSNPTSLNRGLSKLEGPVPAVQLHDDLSIPPHLKATRGEIVHVHPPDGSTHMVLSLEDSREVISKGWGQRHRLSGGGLLPWSYTLIYAPRTEEDMDIWRRIVKAAVRFSVAGVTTVNFDEESTTI